LKTHFSAAVCVAFLVVGCSIKSAKIAEVPKPAVSETPIQKMQSPALESTAGENAVFGDLLMNVSTSKEAFNPSLGEEMAIYCKLSRSAQIKVEIFDPDWALVRTLETKQVNPGKIVLVWDGKDSHGETAPDEAYFFTITALDASGRKELYDPTTFSGGEERDITKVDIDPATQTIGYRMPEMGRVLIRMGLSGGPLLNTLVDWQPRIKGAVTEYWNGKDKDNLMDLREHQNFKMLVTYFTLPENSIILFGNKQTSYSSYKKTAAGRPAKPERSGAEIKRSSHYRLSRVIDRSPELQVSFTNAKDDGNGTTTLKDRALVKVELDEESKRFLEEKQFEIVFFLNGKFYAEDEAGYTPFNWVWDLSEVEKGEHLFTVNVSSFSDQVGVASRRVRVER